MNDKKQTLRNTVRATKYMLSFVWKEKSGKHFIFIKGIMALLNALFPLVYTIMPGLIINELMNEQKINTLIIYVGILITTPVVSQIINFVANKNLSKLSLELNLKFDTDFFDHVAMMDYETLEKPDIQILKERAQKTLSDVVGVVNQFSSLMLAVFTLIAISSIVITLNPLILVLIICIMYVNSLITKRVNYKKHLLSQELSKYERYQGAYTYMLDHFSYAKEVRLFSINSLLINMLTGSKKESNKLELKYQVNQGIPATFQSVTNFILQLALYAYLIYCVIDWGLSIGSMTIYLAAVGQFSGSLGNVFNSYLRIANSSLKARELMEFLNLPLRQYKTGNKTPNYDGNLEIEFKNVSFKYPGSEIYALKNMNITIRRNEKLCIVGANGSGKSTFIKLLTRLYFPTEGEILFNGININEYDYKKYQRLFAPVFQDFARYYMTLGKNIVLANKYDREQLDKVCSECGLLSLVKKIPKGYDTQVGKWIDEEGFNPSGGEEQRMAIARACYHGGEIFLLDEPTASLDPEAEYEIYTQFNNMITNKTAVLITHRLSAVQLADKVAVFDNGSLIEYGTHKQLYRIGGVYTKMFDKQAEFYRDSAQHLVKK
ncbi:ABC transporter ATP-binding protein [Mycoplasmatota bacterium]|nr:ABC transporter ATP-binding protein [Mycoplasmatota bacterium]